MKAMVLLVSLSIGAGALAGEGGGPLSAVPFTAVKFADGFWAPRLATNRQKSLPHNIKWCEETGRIANFARAGGLEEGKFQGIYFNDSDVYKVLEGASYSLADHPDPTLDRQVDAIVAKIAAAQQPDGYLNTYFTLAEPGRRWTDFRVRHELYCAGHLFEAAAAHYRATGKRNFLDVATRLADHLCDTFGPGKRLEVCGHEEVELALVKLYQVTGQQRYFDLARLFVELRGDSARRKTFGPYCQDHVPVREQTEIVGHAVRAMYLYTGVADVAAKTGDAALVGAMERLWNDVVQCKMYVTAGIGARHQGEAFGDRYELPNESAYCETCAAIGLALWNHRLNLLAADGKYADVLERAIYNGILSGVALDGEKFFYVNPLASSGNHHRQPFYDCACCPTNVVRLMPSIPGYQYAVRDGDVFVNLYVGGTATIPLEAAAPAGGASLALRQQTDYPWSPEVAIAVEGLAAPRELAICLRIPGWCRDAQVAVNGQPLDVQTVKGYAAIKRRWQKGDRIALVLPMPVERLEAHPQVVANRGRVALQRGPLVYCFEAVDNALPAPQIELARQPQFKLVRDEAALGGVMFVDALSSKGAAVRAAPYYAWDHRRPGTMAVWVRQEGKTRRPADEAAWRGRLYRPLDPASLGPAEPVPLAERITPTTSYYGAGTIGAVHDGIEPKNSCDHDIPRFTWWPHRGTKEWVEYDLGGVEKLSAVSVYWFDDGRLKRNCRVPKSWRLLYRDAGQWKPVEPRGAFGVAADRFNRVEFATVATDGLRLEVETAAPWSTGILEWKLE